MLRLNPYAKAYAAGNLGSIKVPTTADRPGLSETFKKIVNAA